MIATGRREWSARSRRVRSGAVTPGHVGVREAVPPPFRAARSVPPSSPLHGALTLLPTSVGPAATGGPVRGGSRAAPAGRAGPAACVTGHRQGPEQVPRLPSTPVDVVDLVLIVLLVAAAVEGLRLGALVQVLTFGGFLIGLTVGALLAAALVGSLHSAPVRVVVTVSLVMGLAIVFGIGGRVLGGWTGTAVQRHRLGQLDAALGVVVATVAVLLSAWLVANVAASSRYTWLSSSLANSDILRSVDQVLPPVPTVFAHVESFLSGEGFEPVFASLAPPAVGSVPTPSDAQAAQIAGPAMFSTVKVLGIACGYLQEGSGFVVGPGLIATNAHVVAGEPSTTVRAGSQSYPVTVVDYDPSYDLALLRTKAPLGPVLTVDTSGVPRSTQAAALGFPNDGPFVIKPAGVAAEVSAVGRDIYNNGLVTREIYEIDADIQPGNSGGPLVAPNGLVIGMVFSRSTVSPGVGYALASPGLAQEIDQGRGRTARVGTGACVQD
jgi:S1-C subfamily serine protease